MKMSKKVKFTVAISLLVQSVSFVVVFFILAAKKKSFAKAFLALAAIGGAAGTGMLFSYLNDEKKSLAFDDDFLFDDWDDVCDCEDCDCEDCDSAECLHDEADASENEEPADDEQDEKID